MFVSSARGATMLNFFVLLVILFRYKLAPLKERVIPMFDFSESLS